ncbi:LysR family transcriptional regulator [Salipiger sp. IMCC34102]|uniref:LysR family transcriptional regulator n=1 Tax=Salipiger sp. IMCC34102 TaxID=2510647 RepID=UPI00101C6F35|nr:LysR family transcriptional regulator [Salipiger sp. IMCC34102]RYH01854.1 LysR family transcriptional regulator [Salipiger sp. IMCC34102]
MIRNLDLTALRSFVTVAEAGGVTRAAGLLNLTQSAVSMQLKRLEEQLGLSLMDRSGRTIGLTSAGEQLLGYGHKVLGLNDEIFSRLTAQEYSGTLRLGLPYDIVYPFMPQVLKAFSAAFPRMRLQMISEPTVRLKEAFARGECDLILTTESAPDAGGEALVTLPLVWVGAVGGTAWRQRPLPWAYCKNCIFRSATIRALEEAGIPWEMAVDSEMDSTVNAATSGDLGVQAMLRTAIPPQCEQIDHGGVLPDLPDVKIVLYAQGGDRSDAIARLTEMLRVSYGKREPAMA